MSLQSNGSSFEIIVSLDHIHERQCNQSDSVSTDTSKPPLRKVFQETHLASKHTIEAKRKAFMELMQAFSNSPEFEALVYDLHTQFNINVTHMVNTCMPSD